MDTSKNRSEKGTAMVAVYMKTPRTLGVVTPAQASIRTAQ